MKKWVNVNWDEIQPGDCVKAQYPDGIFRGIVDHIGDTYLKARTHKALYSRYVHRGSNIGAVQFQRYEETELPDDWYLCRYNGNPTEVVRYKIGKDMHDGPDSCQVTGALENYKILKRARFEELED